VALAHACIIKVVSLPSNLQYYSARQAHGSLVSIILRWQWACLLACLLGASVGVGMYAEVEARHVSSIGGHGGSQQLELLSSATAHIAHLDIYLSIYLHWCRALGGTQILTRTHHREHTHASAGARERERGTKQQAPQEP